MEAVSHISVNTPKSCELALRILYNVLPLLKDIKGFLA